MGSSTDRSDRTPELGAPRAATSRPVLRWFTPPPISPITWDGPRVEYLDVWRSSSEHMANSDPDALDVYWRPGCPYCAALRWSLERAQVPARWYDICQSDVDRARVVAATGGDETVPTVYVGDTVLVNPRFPVLLDTIQRQAPHLAPQVPAGAGRPTALHLLQWVAVAALIATSFSLDRTGHSAASWAVDPAAVATWFGLGRLWRWDAKRRGASAKPYASEILWDRGRGRV